MATGKRLRAEELAAIANALVVLAAPAVFLIVSQWGAPERAIVVANPPSTSPTSVMSGHFVRLLVVIIPFTPFASIAAWRTHAIATAQGSRTSWPWRGLIEATLLGALLPMVVLLPVAVSRGVPGLAYASAYGHSARWSAPLSASC